MTEPLGCPHCSEPIVYWAAQCRCGEFVGYPNFRAAQAERHELAKRYAAARQEAMARKLEPLLSKLEELAETSLPVIAMAFAACDDILRADKYRNYDQRVASGERNPAGERNHADREMVGAKLFPMYGQHIQYAVLSPNGRGLLSYGPVAVCWNVTPAYLGRRASLLEENSYFFYDRHGLGLRNATIPMGHRSMWDDRAKLVAAKLAGRLTTGTGEAELPGLLMRAGATREEDDFVEVFIYAESGLDTKDVASVTLQRHATTTEELHRLNLIREICAKRGIAMVE